LPHIKDFLVSEKLVGLKSSYLKADQFTILGVVHMMVHAHQRSLAVFMEFSFLFFDLFLT